MRTKKQKKAKKTTQILAYKFRAFMNKTTESYLENVINLHRILYNSAIIERRNAYKHSRKSLSYFDQTYHVKTIRAENEEYAALDAHSMLATLHRVQTTYDKFFDTQAFLKKTGQPQAEDGKLIGYPKLKKRADYRSITYQKSGWKLDTESKSLLLRRGLSHVGKLRLLMDRPIEGQIKTMSIMRSITNKWWVIFTAETEYKKEVPFTERTVGLDFGVKCLVADSDGKTWDNPRFLGEYETKLKTWDQKISELDKKDPKREKYQRAKNRLNEKLSNKRTQLAREIGLYYSTRYDTILMEGVEVKKISKKAETEDLSEKKTRKMDQAKNKQTLNAGIGIIRTHIKNAAQMRGKNTIMVEPAYTSQTCSRCGSRNSQMGDVSEREFICPNCGMRMDRDLNAAKNILRRGERELTKAA